MNQYAQEQVEKLQKNLHAIRMAGGWTAEQFGEMIGVTKQTVRNLETRATAMTKTQYIAIRAVLDYQASQNPDNELLNKLVHCILDEESLTEEDKENVASAVAYVSGAKATGVDKKTILKAVLAIAGTAAGAIILKKPVTKLTESWLKKI